MSSKHSFVFLFLLFKSYFLAIGMPKYDVPFKQNGLPSLRDMALDRVVKELGSNDALAEQVRQLPPIIKEGVYRRALPYHHAYRFVTQSLNPDFKVINIEQTGDDCLNHFCISPDKKYLAGGEEYKHEIVIFDAISGKFIDRIKFKYSPLSLTWSSDSKYITAVTWVRAVNQPSANLDPKKIQRWCINPKQLMQETIFEHGSIDHLGTDGTIAQCGNRLKLYDICARPLYKSNETDGFFSICPLEKYIAFFFRGTVSLYDIETLSLMSRTPLPGNPYKDDECPGWNVVNTDNNLFLLKKDESGLPCIKWNIHADKKISDCEPIRLYCPRKYAVNRDLTLARCASYADKNVCIWDAFSGNLLNLVKLPDVIDMNSFEWSPDLNYFFCYSKDRTKKFICDALRGTIIVTLNNQYAKFLSWSPDSTYFVLCNSRSNCIQLFNSINGQYICSINKPSHKGENSYNIERWKIENDAIVFSYYDFHKRQTKIFDLSDLKDQEQKIQKDLTCDQIQLLFDVDKQIKKRTYARLDKEQTRIFKELSIAIQKNLSKFVWINNRFRKIKGLLATLVIAGAAVISYGIYKHFKS